MNKGYSFGSLRRGLKALCLAGLMLASANASAAWPDKPITMVVSYGAGGSVDYIARLLAPRLSERLGQEIVVKNVGGAAGSIGAMQVAKSAPDGYTLMLGSGSEVAIAWAVNPDLKYNGLKDLAAIALVGTSPMVIVGNKGVAAGSLDALLDYARANPGALSLATSGVGTPQHLLLEYINRRAKTDILHVPYRSAGSILSDVMGGRVDLSILTLTTALTQLEGGKLQSYALTGKQRMDVLPGTPVLEENAALKDADFSLWFGLLAPGGTSKDIIERLNREVNAILEEPAIQKSLKEQGLDAGGGTSAAFADFIKKDSEKYQQIIKSANIVVRS